MSNRKPGYSPNKSALTKLKESKSRTIETNGVTLHMEMPTFTAVQARRLGDNDPDAVMELLANSLKLEVEETIQLVAMLGPENELMKAFVDMLNPRHISEQEDPNDRPLDSAESSG